MAAMNGCITCLRWTVFALNLFFWLAGLGILGVALWLRFDPAVGEKVLSLHKNLQEFYTSIYLLMAAGAIMTLFGFLGCFGALKMSQGMLTAFFILLIIVFTIELACALVAYFHRDMLREYVEKSLSEAIRENYGKQGYNATTNVIDYVQETFKCCGVTNYRIYHYLTATREGEGPEFGIGSSPVLRAPKSCCTEDALKEYGDQCGSGKEFRDEKMLRHETHLYQKGCSEAIQEQLYNHLGLIIGLSVGIGCLQLLGMILSMCLCCAIEYKKEQDYGKLAY